MARIWAGYDEVDRAVETVALSLEKTGAIPEILICAYWISLERSSRGLVQRFYEQLASRCPEALQFFAQRPTALEPE